MSIPRTVLMSWVCILLAGCRGARENRIVIGSKNFTEQLVLGELLAQHIEAKTHLPVDRRFYLAGTYVCHQAIIAGRIDLYVEYAGTALSAILKEPVAKDPGQAYARIQRSYAERFHLAVTEPLGFENTFAIVIRGPDARRLHIKTLSEAAAFAPGWRPGFGYEFMERPDGYQGLVRAYGLNFLARPRIMDLGLLYRALQEKQVDVVAGNSTDGLIAARDLAVLEDNRHYFPPYLALPVVREATLAAHPEVRAALQELAGMISDQDMRKMNFAVDGKHEDAKEVVHAFLQSKHLGE